MVFLLLNSCMHLKYGLRFHEAMGYECVRGRFLWACSIARSPSANKLGLDKREAMRKRVSILESS